MVWKDTAKGDRSNVATSMDRRALMRNLGAVGLGALTIGAERAAANPGPNPEDDDDAGGGGGGSGDFPYSSKNTHTEKSRWISGIQFVQDVGIRMEYWGTFEGNKNRDPMTYFHDFSVYGKGGAREIKGSQENKDYALGDQQVEFINNGSGTIWVPGGKTDQRGAKPNPGQYDTNSNTNQAIVDGFKELVSTMNPAIGSVVSAQTIVDSLFIPDDKGLQDSVPITWDYGDWNIIEGDFPADTSNHTRFMLENTSQSEYSVTAKQSIPETRASSSGRVEAGIRCDNGYSYSTQSATGASTQEEPTSVKISVENFPKDSPIRELAEDGYVKKTFYSPTFGEV